MGIAQDIHSRASKGCRCMYPLCADCPMHAAQEHRPAEGLAGAGAALRGAPAMTTATAAARAGAGELNIQLLRDATLWHPACAECCMHAAQELWAGDKLAGAATAPRGAMAIIMDAGCSMGHQKSSL